MPHSSPFIIHLKCPSCAAQNFEIRALKDEGLANLRCLACDRNYLLLDSHLYWFDTIQAGYPRVTKCSCKSSAFKVTCEYEYREDGDVRSIDVATICAACARQKRLLSMDIKYSDTQDLVQQPLKLCANPKILYDLKELTLYVTPDDIARIAHYLASTLNCSFTARVRVGEQWAIRHYDGSNIAPLIQSDTLASHKITYFSIYVHKGIPKLADTHTLSVKEDDLFWKRNEVIYIKSPTHMVWDRGPALLYYIKFSTEFVEGETITKKSDDFIKLTNILMNWLKSQFVSCRGPRAFDNPSEHTRIFDNRFTKNR